MMMVDEVTRQYIHEKSVQFIAECPWFSLRKASRVATQLSNDILQSSGLRITQLAVLVMVEVMELPQVTELASELVMDHSTLSRNLKPLERQGLIETSAGEDRRTRVVSLTTKGEETLAQALPLWEKAKVALGNIFGEQRVAVLLGMVAALSEISPDDLI